MDGVGKHRQIIDGLRLKTQPRAGDQRRGSKCQHKQRPHRDRDDEAALGRVLDQWAFGHPRIVHRTDEGRRVAVRLSRVALSAFAGLLVRGVAVRIAVAVAVLVAVAPASAARVVGGDDANHGEYEVSLT